MEGNTKWFWLTSQISKWYHTTVLQRECHHVASATK